MKRTNLLSKLAHFRHANRRYRFITLLASLLLMFVAMAAVYMFQDNTKRLLPALSVALLFDLMLLSAVNAVSQTRKTMTLAISIAIPAALFSLLSILFSSISPPTIDKSILVINNLLSIIFITLVIILVLDFLFRAYHIDANMICASLCIYLLMGVGWASLYSLCEVFHPNSFVYAYTEQFEQASMEFRGEKSLIPIYYSFVTLTTLGYGDIVPFSPPAKILAILEAVIGQIYLTVLVARLVGLHIAHVTSRHPNDPK